MNWRHEKFANTVETFDADFDRKKTNLKKLLWIYNLKEKQGLSDSLVAMTSFVMSYVCNSILTFPSSGFYLSKKKEANFTKVIFHSKLINYFHIFLRH